jgi:tetratricopeptide (TPR) repeat protein
MCAVISALFCVTAAGQDVTDLLATGDEAWEGRGAYGDPNNKKALDAYVAAAEEDVYHFESHWKAARSCWWMSDQMLAVSNDPTDHIELALMGMDLSNRARLIAPDSMEGHLYYALCASHYMYGVGTLEAMRDGVFEEVLSELLWCFGKDPAYEEGRVLLGLSAYYRLAPWPERNQEKALTYAEEARTLNPISLRAAVYLAACFQALGEYSRAVELLTEAAEIEPDKTNEPDYRRWRRIIRDALEAGGLEDIDRIR